MKKKLYPRQSDLQITSFSKDGLTTFHLQFKGRRFGFVHYGHLSATSVILALNAFSRTVRKEFLRAQADQ